MDSAKALTALSAALPSDAIIVDRDITRSLSHDEAEWAPRRRTSCTDQGELE